MHSYALFGIYLFLVGWAGWLAMLFYSLSSDASASGRFSLVVAGFILRCLIMFFMLGGIVIVQDFLLPPDSWLVGQFGFGLVKQFGHWQIVAIILALCFCCRLADHMLFSTIDRGKE